MRGVNMFCLVSYFVFALVVPSFARVKENYNGNPIVCADPRAIESGNKFFSFFDSTVQNTIKTGNTQDMRPLFPQTIFEYVNIANETCYNDNVSRERDSLEFYKLVKFSLKRAFNDFIDIGGAGCIEAIKGKITECVTNTIGKVRGANNKYHVLWKASGFDYDVTSCRQMNRIKNCTLNAMRTEGYYKCVYETSLVLYVSSLFDYMLERCTRLVPAWPQPECPTDKGNRTVTILLGVLLTLTALGITYLSFRSWRHHLCSGNWKLFR